MVSAFTPDLKYAVPVEPRVPTIVSLVSDAIIYAVSGTGTLIVKEGFEDELKQHILEPGSFAFVPAWTEHQFVNSTDHDVVWVITQSGSTPLGAVLTYWGGDEAPSPVQH